MASVQNQSPGDPAFVQMMKSALEAQVRETLKAPLMKQAETMVDAAVDSAVVALKPRLETWINQRFETLEVNILVERVGERTEA
jgi:hypothetical protein